MPSACDGTRRSSDSPNSSEPPSCDFATRQGSELSFLGKNRAISEAKTSKTEWDAAAIAADKVAAVRDSPQGRLALASATYRGPTGHAPHHLPFRRAAMSFMRWEAQRGVLNPLDGEPPGSRWWRR